MYKNLLSTYYVCIDINVMQDIVYKSLSRAHYISFNIDICIRDIYLLLMHMSIIFHLIKTIKIRLYLNRFSL